MYRNLIAILFVFVCALAAFSQPNVEKQDQAEKIINGEENQSVAVLRSDPVDKNKPIPAKKDKPNYPNKKSASDDYHKFEVAGGYSHNFTICCLAKEQSSAVTVPFFSGGVPVSAQGTIISSSFDFSERASFKGFDASVTYNFSKYIGATVDFSGYYGSGLLILPAGRFNPSLNGGSASKYPFPG